MDLSAQLPYSPLAPTTTQDILNALTPSIRDRIAGNLLFPPAASCSWPKRALGEALLLAAKLWVRRQRPPLPDKTPMSQAQLRALYDVQSKRYLHNHAKTTYREDDSWRLWLGQAIVTKIRDVNLRYRRAARHLDLFAGSGLSYMSQAKVFALHDVWVNTILLDQSAGMLDVAAKHTIPKAEQRGYAKFIAPGLSDADKHTTRQQSRRTVEIAHGTHEGNCAGASAPRGEKLLAANSLDVASIMFGIGAVDLDKAMATSHELLRVLREGGRFAITDMHRPVAELAARWSWPAPVEFRWAWLEQEAYRRITLPYVLRRLWGWYDPSLYPHLMKLAVLKSEGAWYGWEEILFGVRSRRWDFGIPAMPTYQQVLIKVPLDEQEAAERTQALQAMMAMAAQEDQQA